MLRLLSALLLLLAVAGCLPGNGSKPLVVSSIPVWKNVAKHIGGRDFRYHSVLRGGESPHGYELKPSDMRKLESASLVLVHGFGLDDWAVKGAEKGKVMNIGEILKAKYPEVERPGYHVWTNPLIMEDVYFEVARKLGALRPERRAYYLKRAKDCADTVEQLFSRVKECTKGAKAVVVYHPVWEPLFTALGLKVVKIAETPEERVTPRRIVEVVATAKELGAVLVVGETFSDRKTVRTVAEEIGGRVLIMNPLPDEDYPTALSEWGRSICSALKGGARGGI